MIEISRRKILKLGALGFAGFLTERFTRIIPDTIYGTDIEPYLNDANHDAIFRAATIVMSGNGIRAQASIVEELEKYYLYTAEHVAKSIGSKINFFVPGVDNYVLTAQTYRHWSRNSENDDPGSFFDLNLSLTHPLKEAIDNRILNLLHISQRLARKGENVAVPDLFVRDYVIYEVLQYEPQLNIYILGNNNKDAVCKGQSGTPVLMMENGEVVNNTFGIISAVFTNSLVPDPFQINRVCGNVIIARANG